ncbi:MAG: PSD1 and planctomycete cytochrome C domain-containing protein [Gemmataceae bacterium]
MQRKLAIVLACLVLMGAASPIAPAQENAPKVASPSKEGVEFFETHIRPVLADRCYECHSTQSKKLKGGLLLDSQPGVAKGGDNGPVVVPGDVEKSRLIEAIRWADPTFAMPPKEKLTPQQIARFEQWVKMGAPDPRTTTAKPQAAGKAVDVTAGRSWWAFQPVRELPAPAVAQPAWPKKKIDTFVLQQLDAAHLSPSPRADPRTLIQRAYLDLTGLRPTYEQAEAFAADPSDAAYERVVETLLASKAYGQRWGRYWLDVARGGEDNPTSEATNPPYPYAWRYRDWVIDAINRDVPYDRFVALQLAADLMPDVPRGDLVATGFLGAGPIYHKDGRLSKEVIENLYHDDWDERVDVVSRGVLGLTVACARCHDHKFDPITTRDYYALAGVFASTVAAVRPTAKVDAAAEATFMAAAQRLFYLSYAANLMRTEPGSKPKDARKMVERFVAELDKIEEEIAPLRTSHPDLHAYLAKLDKRPAPYEPKPGDKPAAPAERQGRRRGGSVEPFFHSVYDAGLWVDGSDPDFTMIDVRPGQPHDLNVLPGGNVAKPRESAPRAFPAVLAKGDADFRRGSGRLELAEKLFTDAAPLAARVMVNRVWAWHFGRPIVGTPSDFGAQGEKPTHPQLLDDLAARFVANGWSLKWLHREIMLSAAYQQASRPRADAAKLDPANRLLWRMAPRRLDIEAYRDCLLQAAGNLDPTAGGPSADIDGPGNVRRTVYARIGRGRVSNLLQLYGFPEATMHSPGREAVTTPIQQLFVMNSPFLREQAAALAAGVAKEADTTAQVRAMVRKALARDPTDRELALAAEYIAAASLKDYAHALLSTNEVIFWP